MKSRTFVLAALVSTSVAAGAADEPAAGRLARDVVPTFQAIRLDVDARRADYRGSVHVELQVARAATTFSLHAQDMTITSLRLAGPGGTANVIEATHSPAEGGRIVVEPAAPLAPGSYTLDIGFENDFDQRATALYRVETGGESYTFTQFEADDAREAFPCWDEPSFKIPYQVTLAVPAGHLAISNTPVETEDTRDGVRTVTFRRTRPLPSYLLAIATGPFETVPIPGMSVPGRVITVKGGTTMAGEAVRVTPPLLAALERYFDRKYPYEKLDLIAVPEFWPGAMENPGAITFADDVLLVDPRAASAGQRYNLVTTTAHELAHMWFGDLVTMEWWDDLWLNESFASWMGDKVSQEVFPGMAVDVRSVQSAQGAMVTDARLSTRAIRRPVTSIENLLQSADALAYDKGQAVLGMVEGWIGRDRFRKGVIAYLRQHEWRNAVAADLWKALTRAAGRDVQGPLTSFLDQPGVPLVTAEVLPGGKVKLSQQRFLNAGVTAPPTVWQIPVTLKLGDGRAVRTRTVLLDTPSRIVDLGIGTRTPTWLHPNAGERGYYRWSVPPAALRSLAATAATSLELRERVGLVSNVGALLFAGALRGDDAMHLLEVAAQDPAVEVTSAVVVALGRVREAFVTTELQDDFSAWVRRTLAPAYKTVGLERYRGESEAVSALRPQLVLWMGREGRDPEVRAAARLLAQSYLKDPASIDPSLATVAVQLAALDGDRALFDSYRQRFETTTVPAERDRFLAALGSFRDPAVVDEALRYALEGPLRPQELGAIPQVLGASPEYDQKVYDWTLGHYEAIAKRIPPMYLAFMPHAGTGCTPEREQANAAFFGEPAHQVAGTEKELAKVQEATRDCIALRAREGAAAAAYLKRSAGVSPSGDPSGTAAPSARP